MTGRDALQRPENVGIIAMEVYIPQQYVTQTDLEAFDGAPSGKYTVGLGQRAMSFVSDCEDAISMSLTVVQSLLEKFSVSPSQIGRLEVGTESSVDRSKSIKSHLMQLFDENGECDILGVDCVNACYGGTSAVLNAVNWVEASSWDGRYAVVVAADVAVYAAGPARPSGGCGAVAMLIGPDAPLVVEPVVASHMENVYDFYKPTGLFPQVDGQLSITCYLQAIDRCYPLLRRKIDRHPVLGMSGQPFSLQSVKYCIMHAPFAKMLMKGFARLTLLDCLKDRQESNQHATSSAPASSTHSSPAWHSGVNQNTPQSHRCEEAPVGNSTADLWRMLVDDGEGAWGNVLNKTIERAAVKASSAAFECMVAPGMLLGKECGNMYTASVWASLASLIFVKGSELERQKILVYSFGSGAASSMFCLQARAVEGCFSLRRIAQQLDLKNRLAARLPRSAEKFTAALDGLEEQYEKSDFRPKTSANDLLPGTFYLHEIDQNFRRTYVCKT